MSPPHSLGVGGIGQEQAGAHDVAQAGTEFAQGTSDDLEAAGGLHLGVGVARAVGPHRAGARHQHPVADPHGPAEADDRLPR